MTPLLAHRKFNTDVTRAQLADAVGVDYSNIARIENGEYCPSKDLARKIIIFFKNALTLEQLLFPEEHDVDVLERAS